jgi:hypothetical protein
MNQIRLVFAVSVLAATAACGTTPAGAPEWPAHSEAANNPVNPAPGLVGAICPCRNRRREATDSTAQTGSQWQRPTV